MDPVHTLRQPFKAPGGGINNALEGSSRRGGETMFMNGSSSSTAAPAPFVLYHTLAGSSNAHAPPPSANGWPEAAARAVKRAKNNAGGFVYRDGESTGYEDDGSEAPCVDSWNASHKAPQSHPTAALRDHTNNGHSGPGFAALKPRSHDSPAGQSAVACTRYFQVSLVSCLLDVAIY